MLGSSWLRSNRFHFAALIFFSLFSRVKILNVYLNGIVIASLSTASGTRWILTAYRFKICLNHQHKTHFHNVRNLLNQTPTSHNILDICENAKFNMKCWENEAYEHFDRNILTLRSYIWICVLWIFVCVERRLWPMSMAYDSGMAFGKWQSMNKIELN